MESRLRNGCLVSGVSTLQMLQYHFHIQGKRPYQDDGGVELADDAAAWKEAKRVARDIENSLEPGDNWHLEVRRGDRPIYSLKICSRALG
jgi:hypothetical protein